MSEDFISDKTKKKIDKWWNGNLKEPIVMIESTEDYVSKFPITINSRGFTTESKYGWAEIDKFWFDADLRLNSFLEGVNHTYYSPDNYPYFWPTLGPIGPGGALGAEVEHDHTTAWIVKGCLEHYTDIENFFIDRSELYWKKMEELVDTAIGESEGRFITAAPPDMIGSMTTLAGMRGYNQFYKDLINKPQAVENALSYIEDKMLELYHYFSNKVLEQQGAMVYWNGLYNEKPTYTPQNDVSISISPSMFKKFDFQRKKKVTREIENTVYHLDGPGSLNHLDLLLSLEDLNAIQWVPGAGQPGGHATAGERTEEEYQVDTGMLHWADYLRKIKDAGKSLELMVNPKDIIPLIRELGPENLLLKAECKSKQEAKELLEKVDNIL